MPDIGLCAQIACIWEATARKPGNVHRYADFAKVTYLDFLLSAAAIGPVFAASGKKQIGEIILEAVQATRRVVKTNTNLGIILLLAPLASASSSSGAKLRERLQEVLARLDVHDARLAYEAIRLANPGGMGSVGAQDVASEPTVGLLDAMKLAADRDLIARQYANGFADIFDWGLPILLHGLKSRTMETAIIGCHLAFMAAVPDTLIARKAGPDEAEEARRRAELVVHAGWPATAPGRRLFAELDAWLRSDGHRRNPGASADLTTAALFAALVTESIDVETIPTWHLSEMN